MDKNEVLRAGREYLDLYNHIQAEIKKIDRGLQPKIRAQREKALWEKHQPVQDARLEKIKAGRTYFEAARMREANPLNALIRRAYRADTTRPGMAAVLSALATMAPEQQIELAREFDNPILALQAVSNIRAMTLDPEERIKLEPGVQALTTGYIDSEAIRDHAQTELSCIEIEAAINRNSGGDVTERMTLGHRMDALKKVIATGQLPTHEKITVLTHPDPVDRMQAARKAS